MQDLTAMVFFARVVEHGSYSSAARALGLPTSTLSRRIGELERSLGVRLLQRTTRRVTVTDVGQAYYLHCAALAAEAGAAQDTIDRTRTEPQGLIRISCPIALLQGPVSPILARFLAAHPKVRLFVDATNRRVDVMEEGLDLALRVRTPPLESSGLAMRTLTETRSMLVATPSLLEHYGRPTHPRELERYPAISMTSANGAIVWAFREADCTPIDVPMMPRLVTDSFDALREATLAGIGVAYLPQLVVQDDLAAGRIERVLPEFALTPGVLHVVFPSRRGMVPAVRALIDALAQGIAGWGRADRQEPG